MCGITAYKGNREAPEVLFDGLKRLEYRGYDSWGMATVNGSEPTLLKKTGNLDEVDKEDLPEGGHTGVGHNRWATHGKVSKENAHPHLSCDKRFALVHNGIIENWEELKESLEDHEFVSETDSEVIVHFIEEEARNQGVEKAIQDFLKKSKGSFAVVLLDTEKKNLYAFKDGSPLAIGVKNGETFVGSDIYAFSPYTKKSVFMDDGQYAVIEDGGFEIKNEIGEAVEKEIKEIDWEQEESRKGDYEHHMLKEIEEIPRVMKRLESSLRNEQKNDLEDIEQMIRDHEKVIFTASGTSYHASLLGVYFLQKAGIKAQTLIASEFKNYERVNDDTLVIAVSQSGETKDVLDAIEHSRKKGADIASIVNVPHSTIERKSDKSIRIKAGQEICVASTKTFINQLFLLLNLAKNLGYNGRLADIPGKIEEVIEENEDRIKRLAKELKDREDIYIIGRGANYPVSREIALKLKEISYVHAEGMMGGELKHGTLALIQEGTPVISLIAENDSEIESNVKEVEARGANSIRISSHTGDFHVPKSSKSEFPFLATVTGFLLTYYLAKEKELPIDKPRNLSKSITVK